MKEERGKRRRELNCFWDPLRNTLILRRNSLSSLRPGARPRYLFHCFWHQQRSREVQVHQHQPGINISIRNSASISAAVSSTRSRHGLRITCLLASSDSNVDGKLRLELSVSLMLLPQPALHVRDLTCSVATKEHLLPPHYTGTAQHVTTADRRSYRCRRLAF